jgi:hypothetical protein
MFKGHCSANFVTYYYKIFLFNYLQIIYVPRFKRYKGKSKSKENLAAEALQSMHCEA